MRCERLLFFPREINRFLESLSSYEYSRPPCFSRLEILETRNSILETLEDRVSRIESRLSTYIWAVLYKELLGHGWSDFKFIDRNLPQSSPILTILVPFWFISASLVFYYLSKLIFWGFQSKEAGKHDCTKIGGKIGLNGYDHSTPHNDHSTTNLVFK